MEFWPTAEEVDKMTPAFDAIFDELRSGIEKGRYWLREERGRVILERTEPGSLRDSFTQEFRRRGFPSAVESHGPERYSGQWDESKHPRGQPENAGQFAAEQGMGPIHVMPDAVLPPHEITDFEKYESLTKDMQSQGWIGRPLATIPKGKQFQALTGSHRLAAAQEALLDRIPIVSLSSGDLDLMANGASLANTIGDPADLDHVYRVLDLFHKQHPQSETLTKVFSLIQAEARDAGIIESE
jgi:hypothetical protein